MKKTNKARDEIGGLRTWVEISVKAFEQNYKMFRKIAGQKRLYMAVVKSNAYGHGLVNSAKLLEGFGADFFGVDSVTEALALRKNGIEKPILVLGYTLPARFDDIYKNDIQITLSNFEILEELVKFKKKIKVHVKIDTGMHRQGFLEEQLPKVIKILSKNKNIEIIGIYSHFAAAKHDRFLKQTNKQIFLFKKACVIFEEAGFSPIKHIAATSGVLNYPESSFDMIRIGIGNYGLWPTEELSRCKTIPVKLSPILSWKTIIAELKNAKKNEGIGYDLTERLKQDSRIAVLPIGYWHGFRRSLSKIGYVLIKGKKAKVLGRVCMDMFVVDVTDIPNVRVGDEVVLIGKSGKETITIEDMANLCRTSNYEIVTTINPLIRRVYI